MSIARAHAGFLMLEDAVPTDPNFADVVALTHLDGTNGQTSASDITGKSWNFVSPVALSTAQVKFGSASLDCTANATREITCTSTDFAFAGDFTIEFWMYPTVAGTDRSVFGITSVGSNNAVYLDTSNMFNMFLMGSFVGTAVVAMPTNQWSHVAVTRTGTTARLFVDGVQRISGTVSGAAMSGLGVLRIGRETVIAAGPSRAYFDDARATKMSRYSGGFTPPAAPFPNS